MIKTVRINIPYPGNDDWRLMKPILESHLEKAGITLDQITLNIDDSYSHNSHFGNWVYVPALYIPELENTDLELDFTDYILEKSDIESLKIGQKVRIESRNWLAMKSSLEGKVYQISNDCSEIVIMKKYSQTKGWKFKVGESVGIFQI